MKKIALVFAVLAAFTSWGWNSTAKADHPKECVVEYYDNYDRPVYHGYGHPRGTSHYGFHYHSRSPRHYQERRVEVYQPRVYQPRSGWSFSVGR